MDESVVQQVVNDTKTAIVNNNNVTSDDVYFAGAVIFVTTLNVTIISTEVS